MPQRNTAVDANVIPLPVVRSIPHPERSGYHTEFEDVTERVLYLLTMRLLPLLHMFPHKGEAKSERGIRASIHGMDEQFVLLSPATQVCEFFILPHLCLPAGRLHTPLSIFPTVLSDISDFDYCCVYNLIFLMVFIPLSR